MQEGKKFYIEGIEYDTQVLDILPEREFNVMQDRYIYNYNNEQIGVKMGITRERVRQIIAKATKRINRYLELNNVKRPNIIDETIDWLVSNHTLEECGELVSKLMEMKEK